ncbi:MAG: glycine--tRNA ligase [Oscillospiraceae bacterium]|nr:glycine--tRNA ligase [Oscillospiraceae bacterium]
MLNTEKSMEKIVALCKGRGFVYQNSEIYGGLANTWDYGALGALLKSNLKNAWLKKFVQESRYNVGLDSAILMNPQTWVASGHLAGFSDPLISCKSCKTRHRADNLIEEFDGTITAGWEDEKLVSYISDNKIICPKCGKCDYTDIKKFNLMFKTFQGITEDTADEIYLRPETAQGIFVNFGNIQRTTRRKIPFGVAQIGKSFRNEVTPGKFIFRVREFEQMELEFFCKPGTDLEWFAYWKDFCEKWLLTIGLKQESLKLRDHGAEELSFYSKATTDFEFLYPFGWGELWGIADRTDYDLKQHISESGKSLEYFDPETNEKYIPYVIEPSLGVERLFLAVIVNAYEEEQLEDGTTRNVLRLHPYLSPFKVAVLPLSKKLAEGAGKVFDELCKHFSIDYDETGAIGKRYRRQDEIGTPFCVTYDFESEEDGCVTVRERDSMKQERIKIADVKEYIANKIEL